MTLSAKVKVKMSVSGRSDFAELLPLLSDRPDFGIVREGISILFPCKSWSVGRAYSPPSLSLSVCQTDVQLKPLAILAPWKLRIIKSMSHRKVYAEV
jgi:hypothetical protein